VTCSNCGAENPAGQKFCGECGNALAVVCSACGSANPPGQRFCGECGNALSGAPASVAAAASPAPATERRLVSVLFADLVGFTAASEGRDAEDTRELLSRYFETARTLVDRYGGTIEKFIGDAVMAVWGTPVAQEDDAERAVRTALDLVAAVAELDPGLRARAGVLTGEAAVTLGAKGEGMVAGDLVNTASRIQSAAEPGTVLVGEATRRAAEAAVAFEETGDYELKGKAERLPLWRAVRVVANRGGEGRATGLEAPFVGRDRELRLAKELFHSSGDDRRATLVTVVGVAGIGKSRLAWELEKHIDGLVDTVWWHRGRCLAYGDGVAFWALAEMVRMRCRITDDEPEDSAMTKLAAVVEEHIVDHGEREWVEPLLRHLLGLGERPQAERADVFSAWRLFFERMSDTAPVALVFEDLHWADTALLDFIEHLLEWSRARPIFVVALTRPELLERRGDFGAHGRSSTRLVLEPLSDDAMDALLDGLVPGLPDESRAQIRERADGIPLYAVETVRMLLDRGTLTRDGNALRLTGALDLDVPESLQALIAARLDGLDPDERRLIQHASVLGKTFGARGAAAISGIPEAELAPLLDSLVRKELLTLDQDPRSPERGQYGFLQALVQRVAYETLARRERGRLHRVAAAYLEQDAGIDPDEIAEVIAAHYGDAVDAEPNGEDAPASRRAACEWLTRAGDRAASLGAPEDGQRAFDDAAAIAEDPLERARLLERAGGLAYRASHMGAAEERLRASVEAFTAAGDSHGAARAAASLGLTLWQLNRADDALATLRPAFEALVDEEHDVDFGKLAAELARIEFFIGEVDRARDHIGLALDVAETHDDMALLSEALNTKSIALPPHRLRERHALLAEALAIAEEHDLSHSMLRAINNLAVLAEELDRPAEGTELLKRGLAIAQARGHPSWVTAFGSPLLTDHFDAGDWDAAFALAAETFPAESTRTTNVASELARACFERGDDDGARAWLERLPPGLADAPDLQLASQGMTGNIIEAFLRGELQEGIAAAARAWHVYAGAGRWQGTGYVLEWALNGAVLLGDRAAAAPLADLHDTVPASALTRTLRVPGGRARAFRAARDGDEDAAADAFSDALASARSLGRAAVLAFVLADYGMWLVECGREAEAAPLLDEARATLEPMRAQRWLDRIDAVRPREQVTA
jgi:class 3 adenylate cyclase